MDQRINIVTGATAGIGYETAKALALKGQGVILVARNKSKARSATEQIRQAAGHEQVDYVIADFASQQQVRRAAAEIGKLTDRIDALVNNAGTWFSKHRLTEDGIEMQLAVNHLSPFLFTHLLLPLLLRSEDARIVNVSSDTHFRGKINFEDLQMEQGYNGIKSYARSKLAMVQCSYVLADKLRDTRVGVHAVQPGLVRTDIGHKHTIGLHSVVWWLRKMGGVSPEKGAETSIYLASSPEVSDVSGKYWDKCKPKASSKRSYDRKVQEKIWEVSKELTGIDRYVLPKPA